jgi:outer membrane protein OmpA-like peptidoglycan-associated protein
MWGKLAGAYVPLGILRGNKTGKRAVANTLFKITRLAAGAALVAALAIQGAAVSAQTKSQSGRDGGQYIPTIWVDPDGCEHWVMDDGAEGYMSPHTNRQGIPVCHRGNVCGVMQSDQFFATNSARISQSGQAHLRDFFVKTGAISYIITGHTDSRASDEYNMRLSLNRANAVANVANAAGARIADVRGYGERQPAASNGSAAGMAKNRRVEIICIR